MLPTLPVTLTDPSLSHSVASLIRQMNGAIPVVTLKI
jgi:hypothetical protein